MEQRFSSLIVSTSFTGRILAQLSNFRGIHWMLQDFMALGEAEVDGEAGRDSKPSDPIATLPLR